MHRNLITGAISNMPIGAVQQPAPGIQHQLEDQRDCSRPQGTRCRSRQEGRAGLFDEVCELHTIACRGLCKITFHFQTASNYSGYDPRSYSKLMRYRVVYNSGLTLGLESCYLALCLVLYPFARQARLRASETQREKPAFLEPTQQTFCPRQRYKLVNLPMTGTFYPKTSSWLLRRASMPLTASSTSTFVF